MTLYTTLWGSLARFARWSLCIGLFLFGHIAMPSPTVNNDTILHDFIRAMEPDISDSDLNSFVTDFMSNETKQNVILNQRAKNRVLETSEEHSPLQHDMLVRLVKEAVFHFLETKYKENLAEEQQAIVSNTILLSEKSEMDDLKVKLDELASDKERLNKRLIQLEHLQREQRKSISPPIKRYAFLSLLLLIGVVALSFFILSRDNRQATVKVDSIMTDVQTSSLFTRTGIVNEFRDLVSNIRLQNNYNALQATKDSQQSIKVEPLSMTAEESAKPMDASFRDTLYMPSPSSVTRPRHKHQHAVLNKGAKKHSRAKSAKSSTKQNKVYFGEQY